MLASAIKVWNQPVFSKRTCLVKYGSVDLLTGGVISGKNSFFKPAVLWLDNSIYRWSRGIFFGTGPNVF